MEEAEKLCHRVAIMDHGKLLALDTPQGLRRLVPAGTRIELRVRDGSAPLSDATKASILATVRALPGITAAEGTTARPQGESAGDPPPWVAAMMGGGGFGGGRGRGKGGPGGPGGGPGMPGGMPPMPPPGGDEPMLRLYAERAGELAVRAAQVVLDSGLELADLHLAQPSLEDVFIHLTGKGLRD